jgi:two-component system chemotaxis sensor kinase CheA
MNLAEELLINRMRLDSVKEKLQHPELSAALDTLSRLVSELQYNVMQSRLVPIGFVFSRFPRMVRDLAKQQKKEVNLEMMGSDIELDRAVIDEIGESLVHLLRNAVDHGMETPDARKKAGKASQGTIRITAERTKSFAIIKVSDDGQGLDLEEIKSTAIKNKVLSPEATTEENLSEVM